MAPVPDQRIHVSMDQQQRLHELETAFIASPRHAVSVRRDLNKAWPQLEYSFEELSEAMDSDIRAVVCTKLTGVAGHLLDTTRGRSPSRHAGDWSSRSSGELARGDGSRRHRAFLLSGISAFHEWQLIAVEAIVVSHGNRSRAVRRRGRLRQRA
jgi:hypothetical protein